MVLAEQAPLIGGALTKLAGFQRPDQTPKPAESPDCVHYRAGQSFESRKVSHAEDSPDATALRY